jgi:hypothetical protein
MNIVNPSKVEMALSLTRNRKFNKKSISVLNFVLNILEKPYFVGLLI